MASVDTIPRLLHDDPAPPADLAVTALGRDDRPVRGLGRGMVLQEAERLAGRLHADGLAGRTVLIPERNGLEYVVAFLACLRMGAIAVTAHQPRPGGGGDRLAAIVAHSRPAAVVAGPSVLETIDRFAPDLLAGIPRVEYEAPADPLEGATTLTTLVPTIDPSIPWPAPEAIGLLQYTSGSTRDPSPAALSHASLLANGTAMRGLFDDPGRTRSIGEPEGGIVSWMPLYHDMGLWMVLTALLMKVPVHLMEPETFVMRPARWLRAISNTRAVHSGGPCSAYERCVEKIDADTRARLDLSSWRYAFNGAEPIRPSTLARFQAAFGPCGFAGMTPCYGLAEHTLLVSVRRRDDLLRSRVAARTALDAGRLEVKRTVEIDGGPEQIDGVPLAEDEVGVVPCGGAIEGHEIVIRDPETGRRMPDGGIGEITLRGPSIASGYFGRPEATRETFPREIDGEPGPWLRSGDLGAMFEGELHVLGRRKDLLIVDGRNVHPSDVEATLESAHPAVSGGRSAVVPIPADDGDSSEAIVAVVEISRDTHRTWRRDATTRAEMSKTAVAGLEAAASRHHGLRFARVLVVPPNALPRTTSGKIRRSEVAARVRAGDFEDLLAD